MFFSQTSDGKTLNGRAYPHPPLVFVLDGEHGLSVRALPENRRPAARSAVAIAPYWNVNESGSSSPPTHPGWQDRLSAVWPLILRTKCAGVP
jgi:hypothetical protein